MNDCLHAFAPHPKRALLFCTGCGETRAIAQQQRREPAAPRRPRAQAQPQQQPVQTELDLRQIEAELEAEAFRHMRAAGLDERRLREMTEGLGRRQPPQAAPVPERDPQPVPDDGYDSAIATSTDFS